MLKFSTVKLGEPYMDKTLKLFLGNLYGYGV